MRVDPAAEDDAGARVNAVFELARGTYGWLPNTVRVMARGSSAAELYLEAGRLNRGTKLKAAERELLAVLTAAHNGCEYCLTAHSLLARHLGVSESGVVEARRGQSPDPRTGAVLRFAARVLETSGRVSDADIHDARATGLDDTTLIDVVAVVIENCLGNFVNNLARTELDEPFTRAAEQLREAGERPSPTATLRAT